MSKGAKQALLGLIYLVYYLRAKSVPSANMWQSGSVYLYMYAQNGRCKQVFCNV